MEKEAYGESVKRLQSLVLLMSSNGDLNLETLDQIKARLKEIQELKGNFLYFIGDTITWGDTLSEMKSLRIHSLADHIAGEHGYESSRGEWEEE